MKGLIIDDLDLETGYTALALQSLITATATGVTIHTYLKSSDPAAATVNTLIMSGLFVMVTVLAAVMIKDAVNGGEPA